MIKIGNEPRDRVLQSTRNNKEKETLETNHHQITRQELREFEVFSNGPPPMNYDAVTLGEIVHYGCNSVFVLFLSA